MTEKERYWVISIKKKMHSRHMSYISQIKMVKSIKPLHFHISSNIYVGIVSSISDLTSCLVRSGKKQVANFEITYKKLDKTFYLFCQDESTWEAREGDFPLLILIKSGSMASIMRMSKSINQFMAYLREYFTYCVIKHISCCTKLTEKE